MMNEVLDALHGPQYDNPSPRRGKFCGAPQARAYPDPERHVRGAVEMTGFLPECVQVGAMWYVVPRMGAGLLPRPAALSPSRPA